TTHQRVERRWDLPEWCGATQQLGLVANMTRHHHHRVVVDERRMSGDQLVEHDAHGIEVRARVERAPTGLLRRHVTGRSKHSAVERLELIDLSIARDRFGDAEVEHLHDGRVLTRYA